MAKKPPGVTIVRRKTGAAYYFRRRIPDTAADHYSHEPQAGWIVRRLPDNPVDAMAEGACLWAETSLEFDRIAKTRSRLPLLTSADVERVVKTGLGSTTLSTMT